MFIEHLTHLGFTEKEAQVYLMLLRIGPTPASALAQRVQMKRVSIYPILEALCGKGVVSYEQTELGRRYIPHDPECLYEQIEMERAQLKMKSDLARACVEALHSPTNYQSISGQRVFFCTGVKMIERALKEHLNSNRKIEHLIPDETHQELGINMLLPSMQFFLKKGVHWEAYASKAQRERWEKIVPELSWKTCGLFAQEGHLLLASDKVVFMQKHETDWNMMLIVDSNYAQLLRKTIFKS